MPTFAPRLARHVFVAVSAATWLAQAACMTQTVTISRWLPAQISLDEVSRLAVLPFAGPLGDALGARLYDGVGATEHFVMVEPALVAARWTALTAGDDDGRGPHDLALILGQQTGADAVLWGRIDDVALQVAHHTVIDGHAQGATCHLSREITAHLVGELMILRVGDGQALHFAPIDHLLRSAEHFAQPIDVHSLGACDDPEALAREVFAPIDAEAWRLAAVADFAESQAQQLTPHWEGREVELYVDDGIPESRRAIAALVMGDWATAVAIYSRGVEAAQSWLTPRQTRARAHYNLGTTLAYGGMVAQGIEHLEQAQAIAPCSRFAAQIAHARSYGAQPRSAAQRHHLIDTAPPKR